jgi:hypothetical protein
MATSVEIERISEAISASWSADEVRGKRSEIHAELAGRIELLSAEVEHRLT